MFGSLGSHDGEESRLVMNFYYKVDTNRIGVTLSGPGRLILSPTKIQRSRCRFAGVKMPN